MIESKIEIKLGLRDSEPSCLWVKFDYNPALVERIKLVHRRNNETPEWKPDKGMWRVPLSLLGELLKAFPGFDLSPSINDSIPGVKVSYLESVAIKLHNDFRWLLIRYSYLKAKYSGTYFGDIPKDVLKEQELVRSKLEEIGHRMYWSKTEIACSPLELEKNIRDTIIVGIHDVTDDYNDVETRGYINGRLVQIQEKEPRENEKDGDESLLGVAGYRLYMAENDNQYWAIPVEAGFESMIWW